MCVNDKITPIILSNCSAYCYCSPDCSVQCNLSPPIHHRSKQHRLKNAHSRATPQLARSRSNSSQRVLIGRNHYQPQNVAPKHSKFYAIDSSPVSIAFVGETNHSHCPAVLLIHWLFKKFPIHTLCGMAGKNMTRTKRTRHILQ